MEQLESRQLLSVTQIVDDQSPGFASTGSWTPATFAGLQGDFSYNMAGRQSDAATWTFAVTPGQYRVWATWMGRAVAANTSAPFSVRDGSILRGSASVNQRLTPNDLNESGVAWEQLGDTYNIAGSSLVVQLTGAAGGMVIADGIRIERIGDLPTTREISLFAGTQQVPRNSGVVDFGALLTDRPSTKTFTVINQGFQRLELSGLSSMPAGFTLVAALGSTSLEAGESTTFAVQLDATVAETYSGAITLLSNDTNNPEFTFAVKGRVRPVQILDDGMEGVTTVGPWASARTSSSFEGDVRYTPRNVTGPVNSTEWVFQVTPGKYRIAASWFATPAFATNATYSIFNGEALLGTVSANQRQAPNDLVDSGVAWENLGGVYTITGTTLVVRLTNVANGFVVADAIRVEGQNNISNLRLRNDTGLSSTDLITTSAAIMGTVANDGVATGLVVAIDHNADGRVDSMVSTDALGRFNYAPPAGPTGPRTIRVRSQRWDPQSHSTIFGDWASLSFILQTAVNLPVNVSSLKLQGPTGGTPVLPTTTDPTLVGAVTNDGPVGSLRVEIDLDGNGTADAFTRTDAAGGFTYALSGLQPGIHTVRVRAVEGHNAAVTFSAWKLLTFQLETVAPPSISLFKLLEDNGESSSDLVTTDPRVTGKVTAPGNVFGLTVEFDHNGDGAIDGTALTDYEGGFSHHPRGLEPGEITIRARVRPPNTTQDSAPLPWVPLTFTLSAVTSAPIEGLRLLHDTGESETDGVTTDPRLTGRVVRTDARARFSVEFDHNGDQSPDGAVMTDLAGIFRYTPIGLRTGMLTVSARTVMWDAGTSRNLYGDWVAIDFTLETDAVQGNGALPDLDEDSFTSAATAYRRALSVAFAAVDRAISGQEGLPGVVDSMLIGQFSPFAVRAAGLTVVGAAGMLQSRSFSATFPVTETIHTDLGSYTVNNQVTFSYTVDVPNGASAGPFTMDLMISVILSYAEVGDGETALFDLQLGGDYALSLRATGDYEPNSGVSAFSGSYSTQETGSSQFQAVHSVSFEEALVGSSSRVVNGTSSIQRYETGEFAENALRAGYLLTQSDSISFDFADSGAHAEGYTDQYTSETSDLEFANSGSGTTSTTLTEGGSIDSTGVTAGYTKVTSGDETFRYERSGDYSYNYHDSNTLENSAYSFSRVHSGSTSFANTETATITPTGTTGNHTTEATSSNTVEYTSSGTDAYNYHNSLNTVARTYGYSEASLQTLTFSTSESVDFAPSGNSGHYSFNETGGITSTRDGNGSDSYGHQDGHSTTSNTQSYNNSDDSTSSFASSESGSYTPTTLSGQFGGTTSASRTQGLSTSGSSSYAFDDELNHANASNNFIQTLSQTYTSEGSNSGTFDSSGYTGVRLFTQTGSGSTIFNGAGNNGWTFEDDQNLDAFNYAFTQSASAEFESTDTESGEFSPEDASTLYSSSASGERTSDYFGSGLKNRRYEDGQSLDTAVENFTQTVSTTNGFSRTEAGVITAAGKTGAFDATETGTESHDSTNTGEYSHRFQDEQTFSLKTDSVDEHRLRNLHYADTESRTFSPAGTFSAYNRAGGDTNTFSYSKSGEAVYHYQDQYTLIDNTDSYEATGSSNDTTLITDAGTVGSDGSQNGLRRQTESHSLSEASTKSGTSSYDYHNGDVTSANHGTYTHEKSLARSSNSLDVKAYTPGHVSTSFEADSFEDQSTDIAEAGDSFYVDLLRTLSHAYTAASTTLQHDEQHDSRVAGPSGSANTHSQVHTLSIDETLSDTWTADGQATTSGFSRSSSWSTPHSETWGEGVAPQMPLAAPSVDGPTLGSMQSTIESVGSLASSAHEAPATFDQALAGSINALQGIALAGEAGGYSSSVNPFGSPAIGAAFLLQSFSAMAPAVAAGNISVVSPWEPSQFSSEIATTLQNDHLVPLGNSRFSTQGSAAGEMTSPLPLIVGRQRSMFGIDIFPAVDMIPADGVGSSRQFRSFATILDALAAGIGTSSGMHEPAPFAAAWQGLHTPMSNSPALAVLMPIGQSSLSVISSAGQNSMGRTGGMVLANGPATDPNSAHAELAYLDYTPQAAELIGIGVPRFTIHPGSLPD